MKDTKSHILYDSVYMKCPEKANPHTESRLVIAKCRGGRMGMTVHGFVGVFQDDENVLELEICLPYFMHMLTPLNCTL